MPRPRKCRRICSLPENILFGPIGSTVRESMGETVVMSVDEYETIRLIDLEDYTQEECAQQMKVARTTIQAVYNQARRKLADALINGKDLCIQGGDYVLCREPKECCGKLKGSCHCQHPVPNEIIDDKIKGGSIMKVAVTYENGKVFQHFGHTEQFKVYEIADGKIIAEEVVDTNGQGHGALAGFLQHGGIDALICGGIGGGARMALAEAGIQLYPGVSGDADEIARAFAAGTLQYDPDAQCADHGHGHGSHGGDCHGEGHEGCGHHCG